jgi:hypothetical protein
LVEYRTSLKEKKNFIEYEKLKVAKYLTYEQYAAKGPRILFQYSPLNIFFNSSLFARPTEALIDSSEIIKISSSKKSKSLFTDYGYFKSFSDFIFFMGTLLVLYLGVISIRSDKDANFQGSLRYVLKSQIARLFLIALFFSLLFSLAFWFIKLLGVNFSVSETHNFFVFLFYLVLVFWFFYLLGLLITVFTLKNRRLSIVLMFISWILFVVFIPSLYGKFILNKAHNIQSEEKINIEKLSRLLDFEKYAKNILSELETREERLNMRRKLFLKFFRDEYDANKSTEYDYIKEISKVIAINRNLSLILPQTYYLFLSKEVSTGDYHNYIDYFNYVMKIRDGFMKFYFQKRYYSDDKKVESFIKGEENVFRAESRLPGNFWMGVGITGLYCLVFFVVSLVALHRRFSLKVKGKEKVEFDVNKLELGKDYFFLCRDAAFRERLFKNLAIQKGVLSLDKVNVEDIDPELPPRYIVPYLCHIRGIKEIGRVNAVIEKLGVEDYVYFRRLKREDIKEDDLKKIYAAVMLAEADNKDFIVLNNFFDREGRAYERSLIGILSEFRNDGKTIAYLGTEMYMYFVATDKEEMPKGLNFEIYPVLLDDISLR